MKAFLQQALLVCPRHIQQTSLTSKRSEARAAGICSSSLLLKFWPVCCSQTAYTEAGFGGQLPCCHLPTVFWAPPRPWGFQGSAYIFPFAHNTSRQFIFPHTEPNVALVNSKGNADPAVSQWHALCTAHSSEGRSTPRGHQSEDKVSTERP